MRPNIGGEERSQINGSNCNTITVVDDSLVKHERERASSLEPMLAAFESESAGNRDNAAWTEENNTISPMNTKEEDQVQQFFTPHFLCTSN